MEYISKKIAVWGDSILKGIVEGKPDAIRKYDVLPENALRLAASEYNVEIVNHSYFGCTVTKGVSIMQYDVSKGFKSDIGIIEFGGNDCDYDWDELCKEPEKDHNPHTPLNKYIEYMKDMIELLCRSGIKPVIMTLPPLVPERYFKTISEHRNKNIIHDFLGDEGFLYRWQEMYSEAAANLALKMNCFLLDIRSAFLAERNYQKFICNDGIHLNKEGHEFLFHFFEKVLKETDFAVKRSVSATL
jgi:acyl-CoA thioesterase I